MRKLSILLLAIVLPFMLMAQTYAPVDKSSSVTFKIKNLGFNTTGSFAGLAGTIHFSPENTGAASFDVSIDANTINTDNNMRDNHLRSDDYFDVAKYPTIKFVSTKVTAKGSGFIVSGKLTIKQTTKEISFPFTAVAGKADYRFKGSFTINRRDFGVGGNNTIADKLTVQLDVVAVAK
jgi:polyisoprenoid-binding protein YceI